MAVVENMCHFEADGKRYYPFGEGSGSQVILLVWLSDKVLVTCIGGIFYSLCVKSAMCSCLICIVAGCAAIWNPSSI